ncbi:MAG: hypothetical protein LBC02_15125 [Planctomycetaceae bacterium]|nr:hypothetical protein [Planctomycetaceae bacterium]
MLLISASMSLSAQPPQGGRGMGGGNRQGPPPGRDQRGEAGNEAEALRLDSFPPIPEITFEQRMNVGNILMKEQKDIVKWHQKKRELLEKDRQSPGRNEKDRAKTQKALAKIDTKIDKRIEKSNKKIRKILSEEQYRIFLEKRNDFRFRRVPPAGFRPPEGDGRFRERRPEGMNPGFRR